jgi:hypothetical protein
MAFSATPKTGQKTSPSWRIDLFVSGAAGPYRPFSDNMLSENEVFRCQDLAANLPDTRNLTPKICVAK